MTILPAYLKKGDCIGIVAPAGYMPTEKMETCLNTLQDWGYTVRMGATTHSQSQNYFSGTDDERLNDLQDMLDDDGVHAILCARGGYGMGRIIDRISFKKFKKNPKWIIGFSDITILQAHIYSRYGIASLHAPMAAAFNDEGYLNPYIASLKQALEGVPADYVASSHPYNIAGETEGELIGGNLSLIAHLTGSVSEFKTKNKILFLEDVGEYLYNVDRMMIHLKRAGKLEKIRGLILGGFTDSNDTERPYGKTVDGILHEHVKDFNFPVCFHFPVSHEVENYALKIGGNYQFTVSNHGTTLVEKSVE